MKPFYLLTTSMVIALIQLCSTKIDCQTVLLFDHIPSDNVVDNVPPNASERCQNIDHPLFIKMGAVRFKSPSEFLAGSNEKMRIIIPGKGSVQILSVEKFNHEKTTMWSCSGKGRR